MENVQTDFGKVPDDLNYKYLKMQQSASLYDTIFIRLCNNNKKQLHVPQ